MKQAAAATFDFIEPMKALPVREFPVGDWIEKAGLRLIDSSPAASLC
jgi:hypothetical protein